MTIDHCFARCIFSVTIKHTHTQTYVNIVDNTEQQLFSSSKVELKVFEALLLLCVCARCILVG